MITTYINGRLGNQLFQYTFIRIAAKLNNCNYYLVSDREKSATLYSNSMKLFGRYLELYHPNNPHHWMGQNLFDIDYGIDDGNLKTFRGECDVNDVDDGSFLYGFFQTENHLLPYVEEVKEWLKIKDSVISDSKNLLEKYNTDEYCYLHFRGGDYKDISKYYLPQSYYDDAIKKIREVKSDIKIVVITDDIKEAQQKFPEYDVLSNSMEIDFYLLTQPKYSIIPNSSFSWWAAWLNDNSELVIAPNGWFNFNEGVGFDPKDIKSSKFTYIDRV